MNIVNKLTLRHIKGHKKRSFLTVLSIIVSVAMVTAVFTSVFSFVRFMQDSTKAYDGNWHAQLMYDKMPDLTAFDNAGLDYYAGASLFQFRYDNKVDAAKAYSHVDAVDQAAVSMRNIIIKQGNFPTKPNELVVTDKYIEKNKLNWKVGDKVSLYCLNFKAESEFIKEYVICGIAEGNVSFFDARDGFVANLEGVIPEDFDGYVTVSYHKLDNSVYGQTEALQKKTGANGVKYNTDLLNFSGVMENNTILKAVGGFSAVILLVIVAASVIMIYDSFAVSYQERERYLGMLASVGATKLQKRLSIYFEGFILGIIGIPFGILAGFAGMSATFKSIENIFLSTIAIPIKGTLKVHFSPYIIIFTVLISALTIFISCYIPARRASKTTPVSAIRGTNTVKVKKAKQLRVSKLTRKLYGFEGELAVKNFKRNGRRSRNIVFALVMSVVLFITVTNFSQMFTAMVKKETGERSADFTVLTDIENVDEVSDYFDKADIDSYTGCLERYAFLENTELFTEDTKRALSIDEANELQDVTSLYFFVMDNVSFDTYLRQIGEDPGAYHKTNELRAVLFNNVTDATGYKVKNCKAFIDDIPGKTLSCHIREYNEKTREYDIIKKFSIVAGKLTDKVSKTPLFGPQYSIYPSIILPEDALGSLPFENERFCFSVFARNYKAEIKAADDYFESKGMFYEIMDNTSQMQSVNAVLQIIKVFIYGFITLLTLIAVINIINSISNSMNERKREFAMLKSVGVTPKGFKKMIYVESIRYGIKSLLWSMPISAAFHYLMYLALSISEKTDIGFSFNPRYYIVAIFAVFVIIIISLIYSADKIKDDNIIENLKQD